MRSRLCRFTFPLRQKKDAMAHLYKAGQMVELRSAPKHSNRLSGPCEILSCLPHDKGPFFYRVQSQLEGIQRVVDEVDLSPSDISKATSEPLKSVFSIAVRKR
jgi:hypothetical protein